MLLGVYMEIGYSCIWILSKYNIMRKDEPQNLGGGCLHPCTCAHDVPAVNVHFI